VFKKCAKTHLRASAVPKIFVDFTQGTPLNGGEGVCEGRRERDGWEENGDKGWNEMKWEARNTERRRVGKEDG
jgi:hypothetical protein